MSLKVFKGIVIKEIDYLNDNKIFTIMTDSSLITFLALGVKKITSKNGVALQLGNFIEVEIFQARLKDKVSKLKKATIIKQPPLFISDTAKVLLEIIKWMQKLSDYSLELFNSYIEALNLFGENYNHQLKTYILFRIVWALGLKPVLNCCVECKRKDNIVDFSLSKGGFLCFLHSKNKMNLLELHAWKNIGGEIKGYINTSSEINMILYQQIVDYISFYL